MQLVEKYRPKSIEEFAGLTGPRSVLQKFVANPYSAAWLLVGDAGTGKTTMSFAMAEAIGGEIHHIPSRSCNLETVDETCMRCHYVPFSGAPWHVVIVDEADQMSKPAQLAFLSKLDSTAAPPNTIFFFTCNDLKLLEKRFRSRTRVLRFSLESESAPAVSFLKRVWQQEAPGVPSPDLAALFTESGYNLRDALMKLEVEIMRPGSYQPEPAILPRITAAAPSAPVVINEAAQRRREAAQRAWITIRANRAQVRA